MLVKEAARDLKGHSAILCIPIALADWKNGVMQHLSPETDAHVEVVVTYAVVIPNSNAFPCPEGSCCFLSDSRGVRRIARTKHVLFMFRIVIWPPVRTSGTGSSVSAYACCCSGFWMELFSMKSLIAIPSASGSRSGSM